MSDVITDPVDKFRVETGASDPATWTRAQKNFYQSTVAEAYGDAYEKAHAANPHFPCQANGTLGGNLNLKKDETGKVVERSPRCKCACCAGSFAAAEMQRRLTGADYLQ